MHTINSSNFSDEKAREEFQSLIQPLIQKSTEDPVFKTAFMTNPKEVIERELGIKVFLPDNWSFKVMDRSDPFALYINLYANED